METYNVTFWIKKPNGFYEQRREMYSSPGKNDHDLVKQQWKNNHKKDIVRLVRIAFQ